MPLPIVVSVDDSLSAATLQKIKQSGAQMVECRIDRYKLLTSPYVLRQIKKIKNMPLIATIRSKKEGGSWAGSEAGRLKLFQAVIPSADWIDIELSSQAILKEVIDFAHQSKTKALVSHHDFKKMPTRSKLDQILKKAKAAGADAVKIAGFAKTAQDVKRLADWTSKNHSQKIVTIAMGEKGSVSRILFPTLGSLWTYTHLGQPTAPGQLGLEATMKFLKVLGYFCTS
jgi:3-dehydroquinate dehydratase-1